MCSDWDKRAILSLTLFIANMGCYNLYFYELFWGSWEKIASKALYYLTTGMFLIYLFINDIVKNNSDLNHQICLIGKSAIIINFLLFYLILSGIATRPILYVLLLNGSVFAVSIMILFSGIKHGTFKN
jgi:hypothetical protein